MELIKELLKAVAEYSQLNREEFLETVKKAQTSQQSSEITRLKSRLAEAKKRVQELLRLTRNTDLCTPVHFDFNHEHIVVEKKQDNADRFQIKCYF
jgi:predicted RNase H-like nuclease (RuvC/YqgF family)